MPRRRPFGSVYRRRRKVKEADGTVRCVTQPGWYVRYRRKGREVRRYGGADRSTALDLLARLQRESEREGLLDEAPPNVLTVAEFVPLYLKHCARRMTPAGLNRRTNLLRFAILPALGPLKLQDVTARELRALLAAHPNWSGASRNRALTAISSIYQHAMELDLVAANPTAGIRRYPEPPGALPVVPLADQARLVELLRSPMKSLVIAALETGCRQGDLLSLEWSEVDFEGRGLRIRRTKTGRPHLAWMTQRLWLELKGLHAERVVPLQGPDHVFPGLLGTGGRLKVAPYRQFKRAVAQIGHAHLRFHDLRHITAINLVREGVDLPTVQQVLGHRSLASTMRYAQYSDATAGARAARALDALNARLPRS